MPDQISLTPLRITDKNTLNLDDLSTFPTSLRTQVKVTTRKEEEKALAAEESRMAVSQEMLYATKANAFLVIVQALDAAGKDSAIKWGLRGLNVMGTRAFAFKAPTKEELKGDFLDRHTCALPAPGEFGVWVRSHYEEVTTVKVHPEFLKKRGTAPASLDETFWTERIEQIRRWEQDRIKEGTHIVKVLLNACTQVRIERLIARTKNRDKHWKFDSNDVSELAFVDDYNRAYESAINATSTPDAPWYVVPADEKPVAHILFARIVNFELDRMRLQYPHFDEKELKQMRVSEAALKAELEKRSKE